MTARIPRMAEILAITDQLFAVMKYGLEIQKKAIRARSTPTSPWL